MPRHGPPLYEDPADFEPDWDFVPEWDPELEDPEYEPDWDLLRQENEREFGITGRCRLKCGRCRRTWEEWFFHRDGSTGADRPEGFPGREQSSFRPRPKSRSWVTLTQVIPPETAAQFATMTSRRPPPPAAAEPPRPGPLRVPPQLARFKFVCRCGHQFVVKNVKLESAYKKAVFAGRNEIVAGEDV